MRSHPLGRNFTCGLPTSCSIPPRARSPDANAGPAPTYGDGSQAALAYTLFLEIPPTAALKAATAAQLVAVLGAWSPGCVGFDSQ